MSHQCVADYVPAFPSFFQDAFPNVFTQPRRGFYGRAMPLVGLGPAGSLASRLS